MLNANLQLGRTSRASKQNLKAGSTFLLCVGPIFSLLKRLTSVVVTWGENVCFAITTASVFQQERKKKQNGQGRRTACQEH